MYKDELLTLFNGINWEETSGGIYFTSHMLSKKYNLALQVTIKIA